MVPGLVCVSTTLTKPLSLLDVVLLLVVSRLSVAIDGQFLERVVVVLAGTVVTMGCPDVVTLVVFVVDAV